MHNAVAHRGRGTRGRLYSKLESESGGVCFIVLPAAVVFNRAIRAAITAELHLIGAVQSTGKCLKIIEKSFLVLGKFKQR